MRWKNALRLELRSNGHKPMPIKRISSRQKQGKELLGLCHQPNEYEARCAACSLLVLINTHPGAKASIKYKGPVFYTELCPSLKIHEREALEAEAKA